MTCIVTSYVTYPSNLKEQVQSIGLALAEIARSHSGNISVTFGIANDSSETMMYSQWPSYSDYQSCTDSTAWSEVMRQSGDVFSDEAIGFSIKVYEQLS